MIYKLEIPFQKQYDSKEASKNLVISKDSELDDVVYLDFGENWAEFDKNEFKEVILKFLD